MKVRMNESALNIFNGSPKGKRALVKRFSIL
jgi:hypothetical protein